MSQDEAVEQLERMTPEQINIFAIRAVHANEARLRKMEKEISDFRGLLTALARHDEKAHNMDGRMKRHRLELDDHQVRISALENSAGISGYGRGWVERFAPTILNGVLTLAAVGAVYLMSGGGG